MQLGECIIPLVPGKQGADGCFDFENARCITSSSYLHQISNAFTANILICLHYLRFNEINSGQLR